MYKFRDLKIQSKLRIFSILAVNSLLLLGIISNYFYNTGITLNLIINAERVHNNTFQEGIEDYYRHLVTNNDLWLDKALSKMDLANEMSHTFGIVDQLAQLPKNEFIDTLFKTYGQAYNNDRDNAALMANRIKLLLILKPVKLIEAQEIAMHGYELGEKIKGEVLLHKENRTSDIEAAINEDLEKMRVFYDDFAAAISGLNNYANNLLLGGIILIVLLLVGSIAFISMLISRSISVPVHDMVKKFGIIAKGNLNADISIYTKNEIGELANSFREIQIGLRNVIDHTKKVAEGDYSNQILPRSDEDEMSIALNKMVEKLKESYDKSEQDSWFKTGINLINEKLRGVQQPEKIASQTLSFLMEFLHSQLGSIHLYNQDHHFLKLLSSTGFDTQKLKNKIKLNEGIIGQVANSKQMQVLSEIPGDLYQSFSSAGSFVPKQIVVVPLLFNDLLIGVLELASVKDYSKLELQFMEDASKIIAINLNSAENVLRTNELLQKTQDQASELQVQQEELRVANEELVEHTKVLTENEKKLQVQQEELRVSNEELEERTRQLEIQKEDISVKNEELTKTRDKLETKAKELQLASQYKSEFLANMSHELRTPLNSLLILSNLLSSNKKGNLTDDQIQSAKIIHKSGTDLLQLINEVLDLSKIEAGKMTLDINQVSTIDLKEEVLMGFDALAQDKDLMFNVEVEKSFPQAITTDRYRLMQILKNLLSNAFKFTSQGSISVLFKETPQTTKLRSSGLNAGNTCCIEVSDTGVGIPEEKLEAIFEAFQQADGSISRKFGGTGLGLSISRELIKLLGGEIMLESKVNVGSKFYIYLPLNDNSEQIGSVAPEVEPKVQKLENKEEVAAIDKDSIPEPFIEDDRNDTMDRQTVLIIHSSKQEAGKFLQQTRAKKFSAIVAENIQDGIILAEKFQPKAIMLAAEYTQSNNAGYKKLKDHQIIRKLPIHLITPFDYKEPDEESGLKTLETTSFEDALKTLENHFSEPFKRILIVEDDQTTRTIIKDMFQSLNIETSEAKLASEAYEIMSAEKFDCIILDLGLPDYSGKELLKKLKDNGISIPKVIVYTGKEMLTEEVNELKAFTDTIILKGIKSDERLMDEVTMFLHQVSKTIPENKPKASVGSQDVVFKGKKILVVDDDIRNVFALGQMLEEREIEVVDAENGQVAIDVLNENSDIDLVLMDVMMPVMDGYEAINIIRNTPEIKNIPIICLTAKAMKEDHETALKKGANDYLSKPLNEEKLFSMLKIWLYKN